MSQLKLTLTRDPRVPTTIPTKHFSVEGVKVPSVAVVNAVGGAKPSPPSIGSKSTALTQTQLFTGSLKGLPTIPKLKLDSARTGAQSSEKMQSPERSRPTKPSVKPASHVKPSAGYTVAPGPLPFPHIKSNPSQQSSHIKHPPPHTKFPPSRSPHTKSPPSRSPHTKSPPSRSPHTKSRSRTKSPPSQTKDLLFQSPPLQPAYVRPPSSSPHLKRPPDHTKLPPSHHAKPQPSHSALAPMQSAHKSAQVPPPLIKVATTGNTATSKASNASNKATTAGIKTITVKLPPSLVGRSLSLPVMTSSAPPVPTHRLPNTSQGIMVKFPPSFITSSALPLLKTSYCPPVNKEDTALSPPKAKKAKMMKNVPLPKDVALPPKAKKAKVVKTALLPISRVKTIMKTNVQSSQPSLQISQESVQAIAKATELFISELSQGAQKAIPTNGTSIGYNPLSLAVQTKDKFQFLKDIVPKKVLAKDYIQQHCK